MANLTKIYDRAKDNNVASFIAYGKTGDKKLYYEAEYKNQVTSVDVIDAFKKGRLVIFDGTNYLVPISLAAGKCKTVGMGSSAVELTEWLSKT